MALKYRITDQNELYFVTFTVVNWIDVFIRESYREILLNSIRFCQQEKGLRIYAWVIMTSHVHLIIGTDGRNKLQDIIRDLKRHTSQAIRKEIESSTYESRRDWMLWMFGRTGRKNTNNIDFQFWIQDNHPIQLSSGEMVKQRLHYIHHNPIVAGFVCEPQHYKYSSAHDYIGGTQGLIEVILLV
jgi:REP element-mobilizing transposase RayT